MKYMCGSCCLPTLIFLTLYTLTNKMVFGEKMGTFSISVTILALCVETVTRNYRTSIKDVDFFMRGANEMQG